MAFPGSSRPDLSTGSRFLSHFICELESRPTHLIIQFLVSHLPNEWESLFLYFVYFDLSVFIFRLKSGSFIIRLWLLQIEERVYVFDLLSVEGVLCDEQLAQLREVRDRLRWDLVEPGQRWSVQAGRKREFLAFKSAQQSVFPVLHGGGNSFTRSPIRSCKMAYLNPNRIAKRGSRSGNQAR